MGDNAVNEQIIKNKCYSCGKIFTKSGHLERHKKRATPCLIQEIKPEQVNNPNRCIFCNKIFTSVSNLNKHLKICKVKNGGMDILVDKVHNDQRIRILEEQHHQEQARALQLNKELADEIQHMKAEIDQLKQMMIAKPQAPQQVVNNINNGVIVHINNYTTPCMDGLTITAAEIASVDKLSKLLLQKIYFNPLQPQNHCIYLKNKKDKSLILYDAGAWRPVTGENLPDVINELSNAVIIRGGELVNGKHGPYQGLDADFTKLPGGIASRIRDFNQFADTISPDDAYEVFLGGRDIVLDTIKAAGCKLI